MAKIRLPLLCALCAAVVLGQPEGLHAQYHAPSATANSGVDRAEELHAQARALMTNTQRYDEAGSLLLRAAGARRLRDPAAVGDLILAGKAYAYAGENGAARRAFQRGAARALEFGDVVTAAHAYVDAAYIALDQNKPDAARSLTTNAERLATSPLISAEQRAEILQRISPARAGELR